MRADLRPERTSFRPERADFRHVLTNKWKEECTNCVLQDFVPLGAAAQKKIPFVPSRCPESPSTVVLRLERTKAENG